jgi:cytochrome c-type biogenesis protein CcmH
MNRVSEAKDAYQKAIEFNPKNANVLADYADLIAFENKGS